MANAAAVIATAPARLTHAIASRHYGNISRRAAVTPASASANTIRSINSTPARSQGSGYQSSRRG